MGISIDLSLLYSGHRLYEQLLETERVEHREKLITKLRTENHESAFVTTLENSSHHPIPSMEFDDWQAWYTGLDDNEKKWYTRAYLDLLK